MLDQGLSRWTGEFRARKDELAYRDIAASRMKIQIRLIWALSTSFFICYGFIDFFDDNSLGWGSSLFWLRVGIVTVGCSIALLSFCAISWQLLDRLTFAALFIVSLLYAALVFERHTPDRDLPGVLILVIGIYLFTPNQFWRVCFNGLSLSLAFVCAEYLASNGKPQWWAGSSYLLPANFLAALCLARINCLQRLDYFQRQRLEAEIQVREKTESALADAHFRSESLLLNILPKLIVEQLKREEHMIASYYEEATVLFADIVDFTRLAERLDARELIDLLNSVFSQFDDLAEKHGLEKIKTVGDAYMAVAGVPEPCPSHADATVAMAVEMQQAMVSLSAKLGQDIKLRVGIHSGPLVAGVIGRKKFAYDVWGDTVNTASRLESHGLASQIQVSAQTRGLLGERFRCGEVRTISVKGKGELLAHFVYSAATEQPSEGPTLR